MSFLTEKRVDIIELKPFRIADREHINSYFKEHHYEQCDCSFDTLFLWQDVYHTVWAEENDVLFIRAGRGDQAFFMPPFAGDHATFLEGLKIVEEHLRDLGRPFLLKAASPWVVDRMKELCPGCYSYQEDRDNWEYVYKTSDLIQLPGKKFRMKKNHLNGFLRTYGDYQYEPVSRDNLPECIAAAKEWFVRHQDTDSIENEQVAMNVMFENWDALGLKGGVIRIYGKIEAFTVGSLLNPRVAHIHFEKANPDIRGLYQAINRDFLLHEFSDTEFVNREEDLGLPGLRQAKMEYKPDHFAEKYDVTLNEKGCGELEEL